MANRRLLKKEIAYAVGDLFAETLFSSLYIPGTDKEKAEKLLARILDVQDEYVGRVSAEGGKNPALVKAYYKKLKADFQQEINAIADEIASLNK